MRLERLYSVRFTYRDFWAIGDAQRFGFAEGVCEGALAGVFRGANHARVTADALYLPDFQGVIETEDGATVFFDYQGRGRLVEDGLRVAGSAVHLSDDDRYRRLNDAVCALEARNGSSEDEVLIDVYELIWEPAEGV